MKRIIEFSKAYVPTTILSLTLIILGIVGYFVNGGFNLGVDFQAGLMQEIQLAPTALEMTYVGLGTASVQMDSAKLDIVISGADVEKTTKSLPFADYPTVGDMLPVLNQVAGLSAKAVGDASIASTWLVMSAQENPRLSADPYSLHFLAPDAAPVNADKVRAAMASVPGCTVQSLGVPAERRFMIRVEDQAKTAGFAQTANTEVSAALTAAFGAGEVAVNRSDYVGSRFSKNLTDQSFMLVSLTLLLILGYCWIRFNFQFSAGAVLAVAHDALIMVSFIAWTRMEFNTTTIAAILTILGYSINDTVVIFDRIREVMRLYPEDGLKKNLNRAITETLSRTFITTLATMFAVLSLFLFTSGSMKDFALALIIGMISGTYSTIYIASAFVYGWELGYKKIFKKATKNI
jgi:preprotein translocase subunit SecF